MGRIKVGAQTNSWNVLESSMAAVTLQGSSDGIRAWERSAAKRSFTHAYHLAGTRH